MTEWPQALALISIPVIARRVYRAVVGISLANSCRAFLSD